MLSDKIIRNTVFSLFGRLWGIIVLVCLTPYIIGQIGVERYGIFALIGVLNGYFGLLDFGMGTSFVKYIAESITKKDQKEINNIINTGFVFYFVFATCIVFLAFSVMNPLLVFLKIPASLHDEAFFVFVLGIIIFGVSQALSPFRALQDGLQRLDISNKIEVALSLPMVAGTLFFLEKGYGLPGLMINNSIVLLLRTFIIFIVGHRLFPELKFNPFLFHRAIFKKLFSFGYKMQVSRFANVVSFQTDKLLITYFLGIKWVVFYHLGTTIIMHIRQSLLLFVPALIPAVSEIDARNETSFLNNIYLRGSKFLISLSIPILFLLIISASLIIRTWVGEGYEKAALVIQVLTIGYFMATVTGVGGSITAGVARTDINMKFGIFMAILNLSLSILLVMTIGFIGVLLGTSLSLTIASWYFMKMFHSYLGVPIASFLQLFLKPCICSILPASIVLCLNIVLNYIAMSSSRWMCLSILGLNVILFGGVYIICIANSSYFNESDMRFLKERIFSLKQLKRIIN